MDKDRYPHKTDMTIDLFRVGDVVSPSCGALAGRRGVVTHLGRYVTIEFPKAVRKYPSDPWKKAQCRWRYEPSNVRLEAFPKRRLGVNKSL